MSKKLNKLWEQRLSKFGLSQNQLENQDIQLCVEQPGAGIQACQFDHELDTSWKAWAVRCIALEETVRLHLVPTRTYEREIPDWVHSDIAIQRLLLFLYPDMWNNQAQYSAASYTCALLYRYFRLLEPAAMIAKDFNISREAIKARLFWLRHRAESLGLITR
jgi:hypothetical protein